METLYSLIRMKGYLLVKCHHTATNWHVHRYLSWHAANNEHFFSCVRMECWFIHLFSSPHLFICCSYWFISMSVGEKKNHTATVEYKSSKCNSNPQTLTSLLLPGGLFLKSPGTSFGPGKPFYVFHVYLQDEHFNRFENDQTELLANENKLTGFSARNHATR